MLSFSPNDDVLARSFIYPSILCSLLLLLLFATVGAIAAVCACIFNLMSFRLPNIFIPINAYVTDSLLIYSQHKHTHTIKTKDDGAH